MGLGGLPISLGRLARADGYGVRRVAWNVASRNLPVALGTQLIVSETAFGVIGGLVVHARWPTEMEAAGVAVLIAGVILAIRVFHGRQARSNEALSGNSYR